MMSIPLILTVKVVLVLFGVWLVLSMLRAGYRAIPKKNPETTAD